MAAELEALRGMTAINDYELAFAAHGILKADLERYGNVISGMHNSALLELLHTFSEYCAGSAKGRRAFAMPTGMGKTSAIVAFLTALHRLGHLIPVAVAASRVESLCRLKRDLVEHGVPADCIGLKHADPSASEPSTGNVSRQFQLITHARVRSGRDFALFGEHEGSARPLCIYDETLMRTDTFALSDSDLRKAVSLLTIELEKRTDPLSEGLLRFLTNASQIVTDALHGLRTEGDTYRNGKGVVFPALDETTVENYCDAVRQAGRGLGSWAPKLVSLLLISQEFLQVVTGEQGGGLVGVREAIPPALRNVVILDASTPIRELVHLDVTVTTVQGIPSKNLKSFEAVEVYQLLASGGRSSIESSFIHRNGKPSAVSREVIDIIRDCHTARAFLIFSFLSRQVDVLGELKRDLAGAGINLMQGTVEGKARFEFLTWGNQEGLNGYEHCDVVIMAGVLHRSHLDLAATVKGQVRHLKEPTPSDRLRDLVESEIAHVVYQGASRGSCRRTRDGKAMPMKLYLIHRNRSLKTILDGVMPGAVWSYPEPRHLKKASSDGKSAQLFAQLLAHLRTLPDEVNSVSSRTAKAAIGVGTGNSERVAFTRCCEFLDLDEHGWATKGRSFVRGAEAYGFEDQDSA